VPQGYEASIYRILTSCPRRQARALWQALCRNGRAIQRGTTAVASISTVRSFQQAHDLDQRHGGIVGAEDVAIDLSSVFRFARYSSISTTYQVRRNEMVGRARRRQEFSEMFAQGLTDLRHEISR